MSIKEEDDKYWVERCTCGNGKYVVKIPGRIGTKTEVYICGDCLFHIIDKAERVGYYQKSSIYSKITLKYIGMYIIIPTLFISVSIFFSCSYSKGHVIQIN